MKADAVVFTAPNEVTYRQVNCPEPGPDDVVVRVRHSWISNGTEGSYLRGERSDGDTPFRKGDPTPFPVVAGYQKIGKVEWLGDNVTGLAIGETVFATIGRVEGMHHWYGGQVSPSVCPVEHVWKLPEGVEPLSFAGMVLTQVGYNAGMRPKVNVGEPVVVIGDGLVGQWTAQTLAWRGAEVILVGHHDYRLERFSQQPLCHVLNAQNVDWAGVVADLFPDGVQAVVDTVGSIDVLVAGQRIIKRFGHLVSAGFYGASDGLALQPPRYRELTIDLVSGWTRERMDETLRIIAAGNLDTLSLITHHFPVEKAADAWQLIENKTEPVLGVILDW